MVFFILNIVISVVSLGFITGLDSVNTGLYYIFGISAPGYVPGLQEFVSEEKKRYPDTDTEFLKEYIINEQKYTGHGLEEITRHLSGVFVGGYDKETWNETGRESSRDDYGILGEL